MRCSSVELPLALHWRGRGVSSADSKAERYRAAHLLGCQVWHSLNQGLHFRPRETQLALQLPNGGRGGGGAGRLHQWARVMGGVRSGVSRAGRGIAQQVGFAKLGGGVLAGRPNGL